MKKEIIKFSVILFIGFSIEWWFFDFSGFEIPKYIGNTPINVEGLLLLVLLAVVLTFFIKRLLRLNKLLPMWKLVLAGGLVCLIGEIVFQLIRQTSVHSEKIQDRFYYFFTGTFVMAIFAGIISLVIALIISKLTKR